MSIGRRWSVWVGSSRAHYPPSDLLAEIAAKWEATKDRPLKFGTKHGKPNRAPAGLLDAPVSDTVTSEARWAGATGWPSPALLRPSDTPPVPAS